VSTRVTIDLYVAEHASLRRKMDAAIESARVAASGGRDESRDLEREITALCDALRRHIDAENRVIHPLLDAVFPDARQSLEVQHRVVGHLVMGLEAALDDLVARSAPEAAHSFQLLLQRFVAALLPHMAEEEALMPLLRELVPFDELRAAAEELARFSETRRT
jgi:hemerythrin-like domain-containing protein